MKIKQGFIIEKVADSYLAIAVGDLAADFKSLVKLNDTSAFLWRCLEAEDVSLEELAARLVGEYGIDSALALRDAERFVKVLQENGIVDN
jgi:hypothetical protein